MVPTPLSHLPSFSPAPLSSGLTAEGAAGQAVLCPMLDMGTEVQCRSDLIQGTQQSPATGPLYFLLKESCLLACFTGEIPVRVQEAPTLPGMVASRGCGWRKREREPRSLLQSIPRIRPGAPVQVQQNRFSRAAPNSLSPSLGLRALKIWSITHNSLRAFPSTKQALIFPNIGSIVSA